ncbi:hypothetical protein BGX27_010365 [Mortierella sp. AM989]|nr:hypothetical protein BGX27_010365 [Mortierella sp. AM989]
MSQVSHSRQETQSRTRTPSRASSIARTKSTTSRTPSPDSHSQKQDSIRESTTLEHDSPSADATSLLGSMWNLVRDAREVAARELDKLLEHFPYKNTSRLATKDKINMRDQILSKKKAQSMPTTLPPKSLLGHGPRVKQRGYSSRARQHILAKKLLDEDLKNHVNDVSPLNQFLSSSSVTKRQSGNDIRTFTKRSLDPSLIRSIVDSEHQHLRRSTPSLKRDLSYSSQSSTTDRYGATKDSDWGSTSDSQHYEEDTDHKSSTGRNGSLAESRSLSLPSTTVNDSLNNPFLDSRGPSPLPSFNTLSDTNLGSSTQTNQVENEKLNELQQELAAIKEQLASLVSARKDDLERAYSSPTYPSNSAPPPPPPPPTSNLAMSKRWTPPHSAASLSMQNVLKELSSSKVQLRRTGSPFVSRISSAIDSSSSSKYTSLAIRSKDELKDRFEDSFKSSPRSPLMSIQYPKKRQPENSISTKKPSTPAKSSNQSSETDVDLYWPSPKTLERADSILDMAVKDLAENSSDRERDPILSAIHIGELTDEPMLQEPASLPSLKSKASSAPEGKRKWTGTNAEGDKDTNEATSISFSSNGVVVSTLDFESQGRPRSGPQLLGNKKPRSARARPPILHRSMTDPAHLKQYRRLQPPPEVEANNAGKRVSFRSSAGNKEQERQWFRESDMDSWRVGN